MDTLVAVSSDLTSTLRRSSQKCKDFLTGSTVTDRRYDALSERHFGQSLSRRSIYSPTYGVRRDSYSRWRTPRGFRDTLGTASEKVQRRVRRSTQAMRSSWSQNGNNAMLDSGSSRRSCVLPSLSITANVSSPPNLKNDTAAFSTSPNHEGGHRKKFVQRSISADAHQRYRCSPEEDFIDVRDAHVPHRESNFFPKTKRASSTYYEDYPDFSTMGYQNPYYHSYNDKLQYNYIPPSPKSIKKKYRTSVSDVQNLPREIEITPPSHPHHELFYDARDASLSRTEVRQSRRKSPSKPERPFSTGFGFLHDPDLNTDNTERDFQYSTSSSKKKLFPGTPDDWYEPSWYGGDREFGGDGSQPTYGSIYSFRKRSYNSFMDRKFPDETRSADGDLHPHRIQPTMRKKDAEDFQDAKLSISCEKSTWNFPLRNVTDAQSPLNKISKTVSSLGSKISRFSLAVVEDIKYLEKNVGKNFSESLQKTASRTEQQRPSRHGSSDQSDGVPHVKVLVKTDEKSEGMAERRKSDEIKINPVYFEDNDAAKAVQEINASERPKSNVNDGQIDSKSTVLIERGSPAPSKRSDDPESKSQAASEADTTKASWTEISCDNKFFKHHNSDTLDGTSNEPEAPTPSGLSTLTLDYRGNFRLLHPDGTETRVLVDDSPGKLLEPSRKKSMTDFATDFTEKVFGKLKSILAWQKKEKHEGTIGSNENIRVQHESTHEEKYENAPSHQVNSVCQTGDVNENENFDEEMSRSLLDLLDKTDETIFTDIDRVCHMAEINEIKGLRTLEKSLNANSQYFRSFEEKNEFARALLSNGAGKPVPDISPTEACDRSNVPTSRSDEFGHAHPRPIRAGLASSARDVTVHSGTTHSAGANDNEPLCQNNNGHQNDATVSPETAVSEHIGVVVNGDHPSHSSNDVGRLSKHSKFETIFDFFDLKSKKNNVKVSKLIDTVIEKNAQKCRGKNRGNFDTIEANISDGSDRNDGDVKGRDVTSDTKRTSDSSYEYRGKSGVTLRKSDEICAERHEEKDMTCEKYGDIFKGSLMPDKCSGLEINQKSEFSAAGDVTSSRDAVSRRGGVGCTEGDVNSIRGDKSGVGRGVRKGGRDNGGTDEFLGKAFSRCVGGIANGRPSSSAQHRACSQSDHQRETKSGNFFRNSGVFFEKFFEFGEWSRKKDEQEPILTNHKSGHFEIYSSVSSGSESDSVCKSVEPGGSDKKIIKNSGVQGSDRSSENTSVSSYSEANAAFENIPTNFSDKNKHINDRKREINASEAYFDTIIQNSIKCVCEKRESGCCAHSLSNLKTSQKVSSSLLPSFPEKNLQADASNAIFNASNSRGHPKLRCELYCDSLNNCEEFLESTEEPKEQLAGEPQSSQSLKRPNLRDNLLRAYEKCLLFADTASGKLNNRKKGSAHKSPSKQKTDNISAKFGKTFKDNQGHQPVSDQEYSPEEAKEKCAKQKDSLYSSRTCTNQNKVNTHNSPFSFECETKKENKSNKPVNNFTTRFKNQKPCHNKQLDTEFESRIPSLRSIETYGSSHLYTDGEEKKNKLRTPIWSVLLRRKSVSLQSLNTLYSVIDQKNQFIFVPVNAIRTPGLEEIIHPWLIKRPASEAVDDESFSNPTHKAAQSQSPVKIEQHWTGNQSQRGNCLAFESLETPASEVIGYYPATMAGGEGGALADLKRSLSSWSLSTFKKPKLTTPNFSKLGLLRKKKKAGADGNEGGVTTADTSAVSSFKEKIKGKTKKKESKEKSKSKNSKGDKKNSMQNEEISPTDIKRDNECKEMQEIVSDGEKTTAFKEEKTALDLEDEIIYIDASETDYVRSVTQVKESEDKDVSQSVTGIPHDGCSSTQQNDIQRCPQGTSVNEQRDSVMFQEIYADQWWDAANAISQNKTQNCNLSKTGSDLHKPKVSEISVNGYATQSKEPITVLDGAHKDVNTETNCDVQLPLFRNAIHANTPTQIKSQPEIPAKIDLITTKDQGSLPEDARPASRTIIQVNGRIADEESYVPHKFYETPETPENFKELIKDLDEILPKVEATIRDIPKLETAKDDDSLKKGDTTGEQSGSFTRGQSPGFRESFHAGFSTENQKSPEKKKTSEMSASAKAREWVKSYNETANEEAEKIVSDHVKELRRMSRSHSETKIDDTEGIWAQKKNEIVLHSEDESLTDNAEQKTETVEEKSNTTTKKYNDDVVQLARQQSLKKIFGVKSKMGVGPIVSSNGDALRHTDLHLAFSPSVFASSGNGKTLEPVDSLDDEGTSGILCASRAKETHVKGKDEVLVLTQSAVLKPNEAPVETSPGSQMLPMISILSSEGEKCDPCDPASDEKIAGILDEFVDYIEQTKEDTMFTKRNKVNMITREHDANLNNHEQSAAEEEKMSHGGELEVFNKLDLNQSSDAGSQTDLDKKQKRKSTGMKISQSIKSFAGSIFSDSKKDRETSPVQNDKHEKKKSKVKVRDRIVNKFSGNKIGKENASAINDKKGPFLPAPKIVITGSSFEDLPNTVVEPEDKLSEDESSVEFHEIQPEEQKMSNSREEKILPDFSKISELDNDLKDDHTTYVFESLPGNPDDVESKFSETDRGDEEATVYFSIRTSGGRSKSNSYAADDEDINLLRKVGIIKTDAEEEALRSLAAAESKAEKSERKNSQTKKKENFGIDGTETLTSKEEVKEIEVDKFKIEQAMKDELKKEEFKKKDHTEHEFGEKREVERNYAKNEVFNENYSEQESYAEEPTKEEFNAVEAPCEQSEQKLSDGKESCKPEVSKVSSVSNRSEGDEKSSCDESCKTLKDESSPSLPPPHDPPSSCLTELLQKDDVRVLTEPIFAGPSSTDASHPPGSAKDITTPKPCPRQKKNKQVQQAKTEVSAQSCTNVTEEMKTVDMKKGGESLQDSPPQSVTAMSNASKSCEDQSEVNMRLQGDKASQTSGETSLSILTRPDHALDPSTGENIYCEIADPTNSAPRPKPRGKKGKKSIPNENTTIIRSVDEDSYPYTQVTPKLSTSPQLSAHSVSSIPSSQKSIPDWIQSRGPIPNPRKQKQASLQSIPAVLNGQPELGSHRGNVVLKGSDPLAWEGEEFYEGKAASIAYGISSHHGSPIISPKEDPINQIALEVQERKTNIEQLRTSKETKKSTDFNSPSTNAVSPATRNPTPENATEKINPFEADYGHSPGQKPARRRKTNTGGSQSVVGTIITGATSSKEKFAKTLLQYGELLLDIGGANREFCSLKVSVLLRTLTPYTCYLPYHVHLSSTMPRTPVIYHTTYTCHLP
ncbi:hypothetical protein FHG87_016178 [Trinorchestia longiramus]|nr:hypothetical protein FHG87_016178 [Trinorchestia longiramus]